MFGVVMATKILKCKFGSPLEKMQLITISKVDWLILFK
jgi:hypothetical protein